jgi:hypothetical protein
MLKGDWQATAAAWGGMDMPYEQALALAEGLVAAAFTLGIVQAAGVFRGNRSP